MAKLTISDNPADNSRTLAITIERQFDAADEASMLRQALKSAAEAVAEEWIEKNRDKIIERLNVDAIANMVMLEVANDIKKDARKEDDSNGRR